MLPRTKIFLSASAILVPFVAYLFVRPTSSIIPPIQPDPMASLANKLKFVSVPASAKHTATIIFVHGLGDTGDGIKPVAQMLARDPALAHVKWIMPHAPLRQITANMGYTMPGWFDIMSFGDFDAEEDEKGFADSADGIDQLIATEVEAGIQANRIVLGGFSQGGAMSLLTGLTKSRTLAGITVLSGWLPLRHKFDQMAAKEALATPIFWGYGDSDPLVVPELGKKSIAYLEKNLGVKPVSSGEAVDGIQVKTYPGLEHSIDPSELRDWSSWLKKVLPS